MPPTVGGGVSRPLPGGLRWLSDPPCRHRAENLDGDTGSAFHHAESITGRDASERFRDARGACSRRKTVPVLPRNSTTIVSIGATSRPSIRNGRLDFCQRRAKQGVNWIRTRRGTLEYCDSHRPGVRHGRNRWPTAACTGPPRRVAGSPHRALVAPRTVTRVDRICRERSGEADTPELVPVPFFATPGQVHSNRALQGRLRTSHSAETVTTDRSPHPATPTEYGGRPAGYVSR